MKVISFAVCCYNSAAYMHYCIDSLLLGQDKVEIIVVDDGSTDNTGAIADDYQQKYPGIVKVIHQENGGHGAGVMAAFKAASGRYFKVVDSDDWVDETTLLSLIDYIENQQTEVDLYVTDFDYYYGFKSVAQKVNHISFAKAIEPRKPCDWKEVGHLTPTVYFTMHACMFRTALINQAQIELPRKVYYEDNYYIYSMLPHVKQLLYYDQVFYCYNIGRPDQSVSKAMGLKHYRDHLTIAELMFTRFNIYEYKKTNPYLARVLYHHLRLIFVLAVLHTRMRTDKQAKQDYKDFIKRIKASNGRQYRRLRYFSQCFFICLPGFLGAGAARFLYWLAHIVYPFN